MLFPNDFIYMCVYIYLKYHISDAGSFSVHCIRRNMIMSCPLLVMVQLWSLKMVSASFLDCKITIFPL